MDFGEGLVIVFSEVFSSEFFWVLVDSFKVRVISKVLVKINGLERK